MSGAADAAGRAAAQDPSDDVTEDAVLGGAVRLLQPRTGYRAATDPVFLAAATPARPGESVLDMGAGVGAASFCLAARVPGLRHVGVEIQPALAALSRRNASQNGVASWSVLIGDVAAPPPELRALTVDHVITNPPYFEAEAGVASPTPSKDAANREEVPLESWLDACLRRLRPRGTLTVVHRAERLADILAALQGRAGGVVVYPLWPRSGRPAKRVLVRSVKDSRAPLRLSPGLVLHAGAGDGFAPAAEAVLRDGAALEL